MGKAAKVLCDRCESKITAGVSFCAQCRVPTRWASHEERTTWELSQWKSGDSGAEKAASKRSDGRAGRWIGRPFARKKAPQPEWHLSLVPSPAAAKTGAPAPVAHEPKSASRPAIEPKATDHEPARDTPHTVQAMRLLNARVAELHDRVLTLERELADARRERTRTS